MSLRDWWQRRHEPRTAVSPLPPVRTRDELDPFEPVGGQDDAPPELGLVLAALSTLLRDVRDRLEADYAEDDHGVHDLLLRVAALLSVLRRLRPYVEEGDHP